jgi:hypothetical protein
MADGSGRAAARHMAAWPPLEGSHQHTVRVISVYATRWRHGGQADRADPDFTLGRLGEFYPLFRDQLPRVLRHQTHTARQIASARRDALPEIGAVESWLFALPFGEVVAALTFELPSPDLNVDPAPTTSVLELCAYGEVMISGRSLAEHVAALAVEVGAEPTDDGLQGLPPERHQIVFAKEGAGHTPPTDEKLERILFRIDPPYREEFMEVRRPTGLNQEQRTLGAVTPYVSLLYGHQPYVENSIFLTTVQVVGAAARFRSIWARAYRHVRKFREEGQEQETGRQRREDLEELVDELGNLELDLSFSVETSGDLGLLIPSLRILSFHRALCEVMELPTRAGTVSQMFDRLDGSIRSEITAIEIRERRQKEARQLRTSVGAGLLSTLGVPVGFLVAFFGVNATEVNDRLSMFDRHYAPVYAVAAGMALLPVAVFLASYPVLWLRRRLRGARRPGSGGGGGWPVSRAAAGARTGAGR